MNVEDLDLSEPLEDLVGRVVGDIPRHGGALVRLLSRSSGDWVRFEELVRGDAALSTLTRDVEGRYGITLVAAWMPAPSTDEGERAIVTVYSPEWNGIAGTILFDRRDLTAAAN